MNWLILKEAQGNLVNFIILLFDLGLCKNTSRLQINVNNMIKTIAVPQNNSYTLAIPNNYIGKKIEILMYALDEVEEEKTNASKKTMADFWGTISDATATELHKNVEESRNSWEERLNNQF